MELVETTYVSDFTKKTLEQFGWVAGDAVPAELGEAMLNIKTTLPASARSDVLIDAALMQPEDVTKFKDMLAAAKKVAQQKKAAEDLAAATASMAPSVREAYEKFNAAAPEIVDDRADIDTSASAETAATAAVAPEEPPVETLRDVSTVGGENQTIILPFCPRCGWDMQQKFDVEIADEDKVDFLATLLGGSRFSRDYELAGGKMIVRLRSMLADENFLVQRQLLLDQNDGEILTEAEWFMRMGEYRMACSLASVTDSNGKVIVANPELQDLQFTPPADKPTQTALVLARQQVNGKALAHEVTRRLVMVHLRKFQRLVEALEAMALEPSFWSGIE
jgi:DNA-binding protein YbaB